jgi:excisionase family DNA binding protein
MNTTTPPEKLLTVKEVANWLQISTGWVRAHANKERRPYLPSIKLGKSVRFQAPAVAAFLEECQRLSEQYQKKR